jgi:hypothetical protein
MTEPQPTGFSLKGTAAPLVAIGTVVLLLIFFPGYRSFFAISLGIAILVAALLYLWHKLRPIRPEDVDDKRPLKLK